MHLLNSLFRSQLQPDLAAALRAAQERKLATLEEELVQRKRSALERKYAVRYHRIRFFERVKLDRSLGKLQRQQEKKGAPPLTAEQEAEMQQLKQDLEYVMNFPKGEKYISLLKEAETPEAQAHLDAERIRLRALVKKQLAEEALVADADEGRSLATGKAAAPKMASKRNFDALLAEAEREDNGGGIESSENEEEDDEKLEKDDFFLFEGEEEAEEDGNGDGSGDEEGSDDDDDDDDDVDDDDELSGEEEDEEEEEIIAKQPPPRKQQKVTPAPAPPQQQQQHQYQQQQHQTRRDPQRQESRGRGRGRGGRGDGGRGDGGRSEYNQERGSRQTTATRRAPERNLTLNIKPPGRSVPKTKVQTPKEKQPVRKREEGGRKRRK